MTFARSMDYICPQNIDHPRDCLVISHILPDQVWDPYPKLSAHC